MPEMDGIVLWAAAPKEAAPLLQIHRKAAASHGRVLHAGLEMRTNRFGIALMGGEDAEESVQIGRLAGFFLQEPETIEGGR